VIYIIDACSIMNLSNGMVLDIIMSLDNSDYYISNSVIRESKSVENEVKVLLKNRILKSIDDNSISANQFLINKQKYNLGDGETECITYALENECVFICDDLAARNLSKKLIGVNRVTGSIGLLRECVSNNLLTREEAYASYIMMKQRGGYLPNMSKEEIFPSNE